MEGAIRRRRAAVLACVAGGAAGLVIAARRLRTWSWAFILEEGTAGITRLIVRERAALGGGLFVRLVAPMIGVFSSVMTRRMLIGIRQRAERGRPGV